MAEPPSLAGEVALVTGGNRGIGRAIAEELASSGARVGITGRDTAALEATSEQLGESVVAVRADVAHEEDVLRALDETHQAFGPVTCLVNNAAVSGPTAPVHELSADAFTSTLEANLVGPFLTARHALPAMIAAGHGSIVNIGSVAGVQSYPLRAPYAASKWGLEGLSRTLAAEVGPYGIRVNVVSPGPTEGQRSTDVIAHRAEALGQPFDELKEQYEARIPLRRFVTGSEVAATVRFLLSDAASGITGQSFRVSGGMEI
ncbi:SDR family NAD(P)-dependent oxidoreductase [Egibacter rhizosphaerae]|nr:SDR family NAD(P)-dependent oxidoreductase [Egibacter rhizosphaerae]